MVVGEGLGGLADGSGGLETDGFFVNFNVLGKKRGTVFPLLECGYSWFFESLILRTSQPGEGAPLFVVEGQTVVKTVFVHPYYHMVPVIFHVISPLVTLTFISCDD